MAQIRIPSNPVQDPSRLINDGELAAFLPQIKASALDGPLVLKGVKDAPTGFYGSVGPGSEGNFIQYSSPAISALSGDGSYAQLKAVLNDTLLQDWKESSTNPLIVAALQLNGFTLGSDSTLGWSAAFVGWCLNQAQYNNFRTVSSQSYRRWGFPVDWRTWSNVRLNDIIVFKSKSKPGGHVGFVRDFDPKLRTVTVLGGSQQREVRESVFNIDDEFMYVADIRRNWVVSDSDDVKLFADTGKFFDTGYV